MRYTMTNKSTSYSSGSKEIILFQKPMKIDGRKANVEIIRFNKVFQINVALSAPF